MTLNDPREALADESSFVSYLVGLAGLARVVHELADCADRKELQVGEADDFVHVLLGVAGLGESIEQLAKSARAQRHQPASPPSSDSTTTRWLR